MRLTFGLLPMGCVETGSHLCTEFCVFYWDKEIENYIIVATNVVFQFNEKEIVIAILKYSHIHVFLRLLLQPGGAILASCVYHNMLHCRLSASMATDMLFY